MGISKNSKRNFCGEIEFDLPPVLSVITGGFLRL